ncbi:hypothetical protein [Agrococcus sp. KRD186]|nr:hypothetical protein [Agrococcus sp. KRD186]
MARPSRAGPETSTGHRLSANPEHAPVRSPDDRSTRTPLDR